MNAMADLTDRVFGDLTALRRTEAPNGRKGAFWLCRCKCGAEAVRAASDLVTNERKGWNQSCADCAWDSRAKKRAVDLTGQRLGMLTAVRKLDGKRHRGGIWWLFKCDCGADVEREGNAVACSARHGHVSACRRCIGIMHRGEKPWLATKQAVEDVVGDWDLYKVTHRATGLVYIGLTSRPLRIRWGEHVSKAFKASRTAFHDAIKKYGPDAFDMVQLEHVGTLRAAHDAEKKWIAHYGSADPARGWNATEGGDGHVTSEETKQKLSDACKRQKAGQSPETRREIALKGRPKAVATMATRSPEEKAASRAKKSAALLAAWARKTLPSSLRAWPVPSPRLLRGPRA